ncbi:MAG: FecR domain-containing protein [Planctomycetota bacterium]|jgi:ferric-dicitrate binding protein FerR (iron transport regulator)
MNCDRVHSDLVALVQEELDAESAQQLRAHLQECPACLEEERAVLETLNLTRLLRKDPVTLSEGLFDRIVERMDAPAPPLSEPASPPSSSNRGLVFAAAAALLLCIAAGTLLFILGRGEPEILPEVARLAYIHGEARAFEAGGSPRALLPDGPVRRGEEIRVQGVARFDLGGDIRLVLRNGKFILEGDRAVLLEGGLAAEVGKGVPYSVEFPQGKLRVLGTRFHLEVNPAQTAVNVQEGRVVVENSWGDLTLAGGDAALVSEAKAPSLSGNALPASWARVLSAEEVFLEVLQSDLSRPGLLDFRITNLTDRNLLLPTFDPNRPRFSLRIRYGTPPGEVLVNLAAYLVTEIEGAEEGPTARWVYPGRSYGVRFDISSVLRKPGEYEITGVFQSARNGARGAWVGQILSQQLWIRN